MENEKPKRDYTIITTIICWAAIGCFLGSVTPQIGPLLGAFFGLVFGLIRSDENTRFKMLAAKLDAMHTEIRTARLQELLPKQQARH
jgi:hypothetical protein